MARIPSLCLALTLVPMTLPAAPPTVPSKVQKPQPMATILAGSTSEDWRSPDPENTLYMELPSGRVIIELNPDFAPKHTASVKALARERYFDGLKILRCQDNYVVQWGDPQAEKPDQAKPIRSASRHLAPEFDRVIDRSLPFTALPDRDAYAPETGFSRGFPVARDKRSGKMWLTHTYGMVGAGRDNAPNSGGGTELYVVIGHAPRHLDRNVTLLGRVIQGMEKLASLPRGTGAMGFYEKPEQMLEITSVRVAADLPPEERSRIELLRTDTPIFKRLIESRRHRPEDWFLAHPDRIEIGNVPIPLRPVATSGAR